MGGDEGASGGSEWAAGAAVAAKPATSRCLKVVTRMDTISEA